MIAILAVVAAVVIAIVVVIAVVAGGGDDDSDEVSTPDATEEPDGLGDDPAFDRLAEDCYDGEMGACDDLYLQSDAGSAYERYGDTCAGRQPEGTRVTCEFAFPD